MRTKPMTKKVVRGLRVMRSLAELTVTNGPDNSELDDPQDHSDMESAIAWLDDFLEKMEKAGGPKQ